MNSVFAKRNHSDIAHRQDIDCVFLAEMAAENYNGEQELLRNLGLAKKCAGFCDVINRGDNCENNCENECNIHNSGL